MKLNVRKLSIFFSICMAAIGIMLIQEADKLKAASQLTSSTTFYTAAKSDLAMISGRSIRLAPSPSLLGASTVGDFVWHDVDLDGQIDVDEQGIDGVTVQLYEDDGDGVFEPGGNDRLLSTLTTGDNPETPAIVEKGWYDFDVDLGSNVLHWVDIPESNFAVGATLENYGHTSGETIYPIPGLVIEQQAVADRNDFDFGFAMNAIALEKTVYAGHDAGTSCDGTESIETPTGATVTYCFRISNIGETHLINLAVDDPDLEITQDNMTLISGSLPLSPEAEVVYYYQTTATGSLLNEATATARPADENGDSFATMPDVDDVDTARVTVQMPSVQLEKTVYVGHNGGTTCGGTDSITNEHGTEITYCFRVLNTGGTHLNNITISDPNLNISQGNMVLLNGAIPLAPASDLFFYYETTIDGDLTNTATVTANPTDENGTDLPEFDNQQSTDSAEVDEIAPTITIQKTTYLGHDNGASCQGGESIVGKNGAEATYCFVVTNSGDTYLNDIQIQDNALEITQDGMTLLSGSQLLAPNTSLTYYYQTTINGDLINMANVTGNPADQNGTDLPFVDHPTASDTAEIDSTGPGIRLDKTLFLGHNNGASCEGTSSITGQNGSSITYCFKVTNTGDTFLSDITISVPGLNIDETDMTLLSGSTLLAPNATQIYYYEAAIIGERQYVATAIGNPADANGDDISSLGNVNDDDATRISTTLGSISGTVWHDSNANGAVDPGESAIPGVTIVLNTGQLTITDNDGQYIFGDLQDGIYSVIEFDPPDYVSTNDANGGIDNLISNIQISNGSNATNQDFLDTIPMGSISGIIIYDQNNDRELSDDEVGIPNVTLTLSNGITVTSDENGHYQFVDLPSGDYTVVISDPPEYGRTGDVENNNDGTIRVDLDIGEDVDEQNFFYNIFSSIIGDVFEDQNGNGLLDPEDPPLADVQIMLDDGTTTYSDSDGLYAFANLESGTYSVTVGPVDDYTNTTPSTLRINIDAGVDINEVDFGFHQLMSIGNRVWFDLGYGNGVAGDGLINGLEPGTPGVKLQLLNALSDPVLDSRGQLVQTETDVNGYYLFDNLRPGNYIVWILPENFQLGGVLEHASSTKTTTSDIDIDGLDNGVDEPVPAVAGIRSSVISLELRNETSLEVDLGTLADGNATKANSNLTIDFGFVRYLSLGNRIWLDDGAGAGELNNGIMDGNEQGITNIIVNLLYSNGQSVLSQIGQPIQTTTDRNGYYLFDNLFPNMYVIQIAPENFQIDGPLEDFVNSSPTEEDPNLDGDLNDNGLDEDSPSVNGIRTGGIELTYNSESLRENDQGIGSGNAIDANSNLTIDFGFFEGLVNDAKAVTLISFNTVREEDSVLVQWETSAELNTYGFHIFRSESVVSQTEADAQNRRTRITPQAILGQGPSGGQYSYRDYSAVKGVQYVYYLQEIEVDGKINEIDTIDTPKNRETLFLPLVEQ